ncbi:unknown similar to AMEV247 [Mythimna separata entomopoxvirus 'L']|uniref:Uncharacterized protein n=1 Tax=Mythimna separata entomopoxvirus 'L' TaxID=1293572 RepID=A0A916P278_9POXV|nr:unknown similar to AMEV247 [Mythimna separata entomopoxvirus 'L']CCU56470.1 unknown similar to AMEV247 [Mythimna separata entomopoxvirus 'L']
MRVENINENPYTSDLNYNIITFVSSDFVMCGDDYLLFIKKKYNSIKELKNKKKSGEVAYVCKNNKYLFYIIISDYIENKVNIINIFKALCNLKIILEYLKIKDIMTSRYHVSNIYSDPSVIYNYLQEIITDDLNLYLLI